MFYVLKYFYSMIHVSCYDYDGLTCILVNSCRMCLKCFVSECLIFFFLKPLNKILALEDNNLEVS